MLGYPISNRTLTPLQAVANGVGATMVTMRSHSPTYTRSTPPAAGGRAQPHAELAAVQAELAATQAERDHLRVGLADVLAELVQLRAQLATTQTQLAALEAERHDLNQELVDLKRKPFAGCRQTTDEVTPAKQRGRAVGHVGSSRARPSSIYQAA